MMWLWGFPVIFLALSCWPVAVAGQSVSTKRMGFYVDAVAHSALAFFSIFIAIVVSMGLSPSGYGVWLAVGGVGVIGALMSYRLFHEGMSSEPWMGEIFVLSLAAASIALSKIPLTGIDLGRLFMGQFLLIRSFDIQLLLIINGVFLAAYALYGRRWHVFFWDSHLYRHIYGKSWWPLLVLFFLITALVGFLVQSVGLIYAFALMIFPGRTALMLRPTVRGSMILSGVLIFTLGCVGLWLSYMLDIPAGPTCAATLVITDLIVGQMR